MLNIFGSSNRKSSARELFHSFEYERKRYTFLVSHERDHVQKHHRDGGFYAIEELEKIREAFPKTGARFLDAGANVGNHSIYFAHAMSAQRVYPVELNPEVLMTLRCNLGLNYSTCFVLDHLGIGLSDHAESRSLEKTSEKNMGAARIAQGDGNLPLIDGDSLYFECGLDFVKIDVEGYEERVLKGFSKTIGKWNPYIYVETRANETYQPVIDFLSDLNYEIVFEYSQYDDVINLMMRPQK